MKRWLGGVLLVFPVLAGLSGCGDRAAQRETAGAGGDWIWLFDGKSLDGWTVKCLPADAGKTYWTVNDGAIVCNAIGDTDHDYVWLVNDREFGDFELELRFRWMPDSGGNSGVQVRSRYDASPEAPRGGWLDGPQADIHPPEPYRIGMIYDETRTERRWLYPDLPDWKMDPRPLPEGFLFDEFGWNTLRVVCEGTVIRTVLNGVPIANYDGAGTLDDEAHRALGVGMRGHVALQLHANSPLHIQFRDIRVRELK